MGTAALEKAHGSFPLDPRMNCIFLCGKQALWCAEGAICQGQGRGIQHCLLVVLIAVDAGADQQELLASFVLIEIRLFKQVTGSGGQYHNLVTGS